MQKQLPILAWRVGVGSIEREHQWYQRRQCRTSVAPSTMLGGSAPSFRSTCTGGDEARPRDYPRHLCKKHPTPQNLTRRMGASASPRVPDPP